VASPSRRRKQRRARTEEGLESALISLDRSRGPLFEEMARLAESKRGTRSANPHLACTRKFNRMRITDLEAVDIARAFAEKPHLRGKLSQVYERIAKELPHLRDDEEPQAFDCPLLEGTQCMVHHVAKPIACLAWNRGREYSGEGWHSFSRRDRLNRSLFGEEWQLKAIPLQLARFLEGQDRLAEGPCGSTLRKKAMQRGELRRSREKEVADREAREAERHQRRGRRGAARHDRIRQRADEKRGRRGRSGRPEGEGEAGATRPPRKPRRPGSPGAGDRRHSGRRAVGGRRRPGEEELELFVDETRARRRRGGPRRGAGGDRRTRS
jgi:hypothetical protein